MTGRCKVRFRPAQSPAMDDSAKRHHRSRDTGTQRRGSSGAPSGLGVRTPGGHHGPGDPATPTPSGPISNGRTSSASRSPGSICEPTWRCSAPRFAPETGTRPSGSCCASRSPPPLTQRPLPRRQHRRRRCQRIPAHGGTGRPPPAPARPRRCDVTTIHVHDHGFPTATEGRVQDQPAEGRVVPAATGQRRGTGLGRAGVRHQQLPQRRDDPRRRRHPHAAEVNGGT